MTDDTEYTGEFIHVTPRPEIRRVVLAAAGLPDKLAGQRSPADITTGHWSMLDVLPARDGDEAPPGATHTLFRPDGSRAGWFTPAGPDGEPPSRAER